MVNRIRTGVIPVDGGQEEIPGPPAGDGEGGAGERDPGFVVELEDPISHFLLEY
jgi:hypothetical protein